VAASTGIRGDRASSAGVPEPEPLKIGELAARAYHFARWCSITPRPLASHTPPGRAPRNAPNGAV